MFRNMRMIKVTDYIVEFLIEKKITHAFGYPGGSAANLMNSFYKYRNQIDAHVTYHEQAAAFAACGYARTAGVPGVAYSIGGPGATNLITGIGHSYFDSIPLICLTGNVNTYESARGMSVRQRAFQECEIVPIVESITKYSAYVERPEDIRYHLEKAYYFALEGRPGPVLLDLPMDVTRAEVDADSLRGFSQPEKKDSYDLKTFGATLTRLLSNSKRPCIVLGAGVKNQNSRDLLREVIDHLGLPCTSSMISFDALGDNRLFYGFLGASGTRAANFITSKSDLIISIGSRLDIRQIGVRRAEFAPAAKIVRVDIDGGELGYKVHNDEVSFCIKAENALHELKAISLEKDYTEWLSVCDIIRAKTKDMDMRLPNFFMRNISQMIPNESVITTDVGQNQVWTAQNFVVKPDQMVLFSGGFGSMGHALPAAIGAYYGSGCKKVYAIAGDGGAQMNIQELQYLHREKIPVKLIVFNNHALGMIRHFQEAWFDGVYFQTKEDGGYTSPSFCNVSNGYNIDSIEVKSVNDVEKCRSIIESDEPGVVEIQLMEDTYEYPKLRFGTPNQDQEPLMDRELYKELMSL